MSNTLGIIEEEMQARHNQYHRENPDQWAREDSTFTIQELAFGVSLATILAGYEINSLHTFLNPSV